ncbi:sensor domain-containing diguanylate cyclase [Oceanospirillum sediminis]|uniref:Diguanylate cyclase n=1 Tax=Oceanospirillum sediminis TaxID=2760088 RepID=A0A839IQ98_9GAMM|nr:sensor domain-containing diguanylate cyclase [Oceanospirillum sediminis]MBB1486880.1 diguanylate cyclase [Oceanospirillum sediminis]
MICQLMQRAFVRVALKQSYLTGIILFWLSAPLKADDHLADLIQSLDFWRFVAIFIGGIQFLIIVGLGIFALKKFRQAKRAKALSSGLAEKAEQLSEEHQLLRSLMDNLPHLISFKNKNGEYIEFNTSFESFTGKKRSQILQHTEYELFENTEAAGIREQDKLVLTTGITQKASRWLHDSEGKLRLMHISKAPLRAVKDGRTGILSISQDITEQHQREIIYKYRNNILEMMAQGAPLQNVFNSLIGFTEETFPGLYCSILLLDKSGRYLLTAAAPSLPDFYNQAINGAEIGEQQGSCGTAAFTGRPVIVSDISTHHYWRDYKELALRAGLKACWSIPIKNRHGEILGTFALYHKKIAEPTTAQLELMHANTQLASIAIDADRMDQQLRMLSQAIEYSASFVMITDAELTLEYVNSSLESCTGYSAEELLGRKVGFLSCEEKEAEIVRDIWSTVLTGHIWRGERLLQKRNGDQFWVVSSIAPIKNQESEITHLVSVSEDITQLKKDQERMELLAFYDPLTGLANRRLFKDRLDEALKKVRRNQGGIALLYLDLDHFKEVNDNYGHEAGDALLKAIARHLEDTVRESDVVSRIGGDEFNLILHDLNSVQDALSVADKILSVISQPVDIGVAQVEISGSIGITLAPGDGMDAKMLIKNADVAMYQSKQQGRNRSQLYSSRSYQGS